MPVRRPAAADNALRTAPVELQPLGHPVRQIGIYRSVDRCYFLVYAQESNQRKRHRGGVETLAPAIAATRPYVPHPARTWLHFITLTTEKYRRMVLPMAAAAALAALPIAENLPFVQKIGKFSAQTGSKLRSCGTYGDAAGWILKAGGFACGSKQHSAALSRLLWGTFLADTRKVQTLLFLR